MPLLGKGRLVVSGENSESEQHSRVVVVLLCRGGIHYRLFVFHLLTHAEVACSVLLYQVIALLVSLVHCNVVWCLLNLMDTDYNHLDLHIISRGKGH